MPATCVIGLQWGDEAKGKVVDLLTEQHDIVVRYQGGANAGHTVVVGGQVFKLSLVPSGVFRSGVQCVVAGGTVLNPAALLQEMDGLVARGVPVGGNLMISDRAHVIFPWHFEEDRLMTDQGADAESIGTTLRGIGPCYRDKVGRSWAIRLGDMYRESFRERIEKIVAAKNRLLAALATDGKPLELDAGEIFRQYNEYAERLRPHVADTTAYLLDEIDAGKRILFEGAQGALLDIDHGTFPFVTSSNSSGVGIAAGAGVPGRVITKVVGILKAYCTRVGGGPFPTEQDNAIGQHIRDRGNEYGTVTKRPRRCGWFDAVAARYTARLSDVDVVAVMLLDVLSELPKLHLCTGYELDGRRTADFPSHVDDVRRVVPVYETLPGWQQEITHVRCFEDLPPAAKNYLGRISQLVGRPVELVSVGPDREQTIFVKP
ncbi:MAG: adenylosuccinate synthase [Thermoguttaceae bacterium]|nr:adenylosuccinate synthase [Thermoguttaceae bacterium]